MGWEVLFYSLPETEIALGHVWHQIWDQWKKVDKAKVLKLFSYLPNYQSYGRGSVEQSPKTDILIPTGYKSSTISTKLGVDIPHGASTNLWHFERAGSNHNEGGQESRKMPRTKFFIPQQNSLAPLVTFFPVSIKNGP